MNKKLIVFLMMIASMGCYPPVERPVRPPGSALQ